MTLQQQLAQGDLAALPSHPHLAATPSPSLGLLPSALQPDGHAARQPVMLLQPDSNIKIHEGFFPHDHTARDCKLCVVEGYPPGRGCRKIFYNHIKNKHLKEDKLRDKAKAEKFRQTLRSKCTECERLSRLSDKDDSWTNHIISGHSNYNKVASALLSRSESSSGRHGTSTPASSGRQQSTTASYSNTPAAMILSPTVRALLQPSGDTAPYATQHPGASPYQAFVQEAPISKRASHASPAHGGIALPTSVSGYRAGPGSHDRRVKYNENPSIYEGPSATPTNSTHTPNHMSPNAMTDGHTHSLPPTLVDNTWFDQNGDFMGFHDGFSPTNGGM
jgi:hypothetical protein